MYFIYVQNLVRFRTILHEQIHEQCTQTCSLDKWSQSEKTLNDQLEKLISRDPRVFFGYFLRQSIDLVVLCRPMKLQSSNDYFGDVILDLRKAITITTIIGRDVKG